MPTKTLDFADYIIDSALQQNLKITNLQLNLIMFVLVCENIRQTDTYPLDYSFQTSEYGPHITKIFNKYKHYFTTPIKHVIDQQVCVINHQHIKIKKRKYSLNNIDSNLINLTDKYLAKLLAINIFNISDYLQSLPFWKQTWKLTYQHQFVTYPVEAMTLNASLDTLIDTNFKI